MSASRAPRLAATIVAAATGAAYLATLAPGVTLWDAGEFASSVATFGVPHPPGTPLYVAVARAIALLLGWLPVVRATNLLSAACTASACATLGALVARWRGSALDGVAAGCVAGLMTSVWLNANETEVYAASLLLSALMLLAADHARRRDDERATVLVAYLFALAVPLHLSALVAAPGAIALASLRASDSMPRLDVVRALQLTGAALVSGGAGVVSRWPIVAGVVLLAAAPLVRDSRSRGSRAGVSVALVVVIVVALSALAIMMVRARFDPGIDQGNPATLSALLEVVARRQYAVPGPWPRRAPFWLQLANFIQYGDWQMGLALDPEAVGASPFRAPVTIAVLALAFVGAGAHRRSDRTTFGGFAALFIAATLGVVVYLNLQAGPSIGYGVLAPTAEHEARERDYFFALGFAAWGVWAGIGLAALARRLTQTRAWIAVALGIVALFAANARAVDRSRAPNARLAGGFARALLETAPPRAVMFVAGDNDTYPVWYEQWGERVRRDVTPITLPLLPADWYRAELARRHGLLADSSVARWRGEAATVKEIAERGSGLGRPIAATVSVERETRRAIGDGWQLEGLEYVWSSGVGSRESGVDRQRLPTPDSRLPTVVSIDTLAAARAARLVDSLIPPPRPQAAFPDPAARYVASLLDCPTLAIEVVRGGDRRAAELLDSRCNFR